MKFDLTCSAHPRYKAKRYPRSECKACVILFRLTEGYVAVIEYTVKHGFVHLKHNAGK